MYCDFDIYNTIDFDYFLSYTIVKTHDVGLDVKVMTSSYSSKILR